LEPLLVELPLVGLRLELEEPELVSGRRPELRSPSTLFVFPFLSGTISLFGLPFPDGVVSLTDVEGLSPVSGRGRVDVPGRVVVPGRDVSGRVDVLGRDVPGRVVDEPGREELPGRVGALCVTGGKWSFRVYINYPNRSLFYFGVPYHYIPAITVILAVRPTAKSKNSIRFII